MDTAGIHSLAELAAAAAPSLPSADQQTTQAGTAAPLAALADGETPVKRGSNLACLKCRAIKVRCSRAAPTDLRCKRCNRLDLTCEYKEHHRGRKPKKRLKTEDASNKQVAGGSTRRPRSQTDSPANASSANVSDDELQRDDAADPAKGSAESTDAEEAAPDPGDAIHGRFIGPYLSAILNPATTIEKREPEVISATTGSAAPQAFSSAPQPSSKAGGAAAIASLDVTDAGDAVTQGVITLGEANELFGYFFAELNPPLALFDQYLHTVEYCRRHRPLVFSNIIANSSRFCRPDLYPRCQQISRSVMAVAAAEELCTLDHIQALVMSITWKDPSDRTIDRKFRRAIGYGYELGLLYSFEEFRNDEDGSAKQLGASGSSTPNLSRREQRDRQRTWIMLCLVQAVLNKGDSDHRTFPLQIPLRHHPDMVTWYHCGKDLILKIDARIAWSLELVALFVEVEDIVEMTTRSANPTSYGVLFTTFRQRADAIRRRWFKVNNGKYQARYPMDESAIAELPYLDSHRQMFLSELQWHWSSKVAAFNEKVVRNNTTTRLPSSDSWSPPAVCFARTAGLALDTLQLFLTNIVKPGYLRVGHDYLVICASQAAKWLFVYRDSLDPVTLLSAHATLLEILEACSRPQYLPSGDATNIEREAPGYLVRYVEALINSGLSEAVNRASRRRSSAARSSLPADGSERPSSAKARRHESGNSRATHDASFSQRRRQYDAQPNVVGSQQPMAMHMAGDAPAAVRSATAGSRPEYNGRGGPLLPGVSPAMGAMHDRSPSYGAHHNAAFYGYGERAGHPASPAPSSPSTASSLQPHPAYLSNPATASYQQATGVSRHASGSKSGGWHTRDGVDSSPDFGQHQMASFGGGAVGHQTIPPPPPLAPQPYPDRQLGSVLLQQQPFPSPATLTPDVGVGGFSVPLAPAVAPMPADKASLGSLVPLNEQDLSYWSSILGSDLTAFT